MILIQDHPPLHVCAHAHTHMHALTLCMEQVVEGDGGGSSGLSAKKAEEIRHDTELFWHQQKLAQTRPDLVF